VVNICTGKGVSIQSVLDQLCELSTAQVAVRVDPARVRPIDEPVRIGDVSRLHAMGWQPRYSLEQTLSDILNYWREQE
jgi:GDP-4-dehydro-6-deoxy-D-mannose reductase